MTDASPKLGLPYIQPSQAQKHVTHNEAIQGLDTLVQLRIAAFGAETPPGTPGVGESYALGAAPGLAWAGQDGKLATWNGTAWQFLDPQEGWLAWDVTEARLRVYSSGIWTVPHLGGEQTPRLGIATAPDDSNRLSVASDAVLLSHAGADQRLKVNKASDADTASLLFQSNWIGHAEMGLTGDTGFSVKVSGDGSSWTQVMQADPAGLQIDVPVKGTAVQTSASDTTAGRLMKTGAFGLGSIAVHAPNGDLNDIVVSGLYQTDASTLNRPSFINGVVLDMARTNEIHTQIAVSRRTTDAGRVEVRARTSDGTWSAWFGLYGHNTVLGAVSQSAGVPTGALIERGSNANGDYVRFADGTQICTVQLGSAAGGDTQWVFPASFAAAPAVTNTVLAAAARLGNLHTTTSTACAFNAWDTGGVRVAETCSLMAIGRWV